MTQAYDDALRPSGLRSMQYQILKTLEGMGEASISDLTVILTMDQTTLTRTLGILERNGWIQRAPKPDRRVKAYRLSRKGVNLLARAAPLWQEAQRKALRQVGEENWRAARSLLASILGLPQARQEDESYLASTSS